MDKIFDYFKDNIYIFKTSINHNMIKRDEKGRYVTTTGSRRYKSISVNNKEISEHRYIYEQSFGKIPTGYVIHHINGNKKDNRPENLKAVSILEHNRLHAHVSWNKGLKIDFDKYPNFGMLGKKHTKQTITKQKTTWKNKYIDNMWEIFSLYFLDFTHKEIGTILGLTEDTVAWRYCKFKNDYLGGGVYD